MTDRQSQLSWQLAGPREAPPSALFAAGRMATMLVMALFGCSQSADSRGETGEEGQSCESSINQPPLTPQLSAPGFPPSGILDGFATDLEFEATPFEDPDAGDTAQTAEFEIWHVEGGLPVVRVWHANLDADTSSELTRVHLSDGSFDLGGADALDPWQDYAVTARYTDANPCPQSSEWSAPFFFRNDDGSAALFDDEVLHEVRITLPQESWDAVHAEALPPGCVPHHRSYHRATFAFDGELFESNVGVRVKGGCGSARNLDSKAGFKINLEWDDPLIEGCPESQRLLGQKKFTLNNMVQDPSFSRERLSYNFYRAAGVPSPRVAHVRVFVNDEYWGIYLHVESTTRRFLDRWFDDNEGVMYEGIYGCDLNTSQVPVSGAEASACFEKKFGPDMCDVPDYMPPLDHSELLALTTALDAMGPDEFYPAIREHVDFDRLFNLWALDGIMNNWDGFVASANNYRLYFDPSTAMWSPIPTGVDQNFQNMGEGNPFGFGARLVQLCLQEQDCRDDFIAVLESRLALFELFTFDAELDAIDALIGQDVQFEPRAESSYDDYLAQRAGIVAWIDQRAAQVHAMIAGQGDSSLPAG